MFRILLSADSAPVQGVGPEPVDQGAEGAARPPVRGHVGHLEVGVGGQLQPAPQLEAGFATDSSTSRHGDFISLFPRQRRQTPSTIITLIVK